MYRDFSENSKANLIGLVSEVENEKISDFTDWIGDRWYDFESWIGRLNIRNYINNVNAYHKKVIDKNNTTKQQIEQIFNNVRTVDNSFKSLLFCLNAQLQQWQRYTEELSQIVNPVNGRFEGNYIAYRMNLCLDQIYKETIDNIIKYLTEILAKNPQEIFDVLQSLTGGSSSANVDTSLVLQLLVQIMSGNQQYNSLTGDDVKTGLNYLSEINKLIGKYDHNDEMTLTSSLLGYLSTLCGVTCSTNQSGLDVTSGFLSLFKSSIGLEKGYYEYWMKKLTPYEALKLDSKFGNGMAWLGLISSAIGATNEGIDTYRTYVDPDSNIYDKAAQSLNLIGSLFGVGGNAYITYEAGSKTLQFISKASGSSKAVNQILATEQTLNYTVSSTAAKNISKAGTYIAIGDVAVSTGAGVINRIGEVTADGELNVIDVSSVGIHGSLSGLNSVVSNLTFGVVSFDSEQVAGELENKSSDFVQGDSWAAQYIRDQDNNAVCRFGVSVGVAGYLVGKQVVDGIANSAKTVGSWVSSGWNTVKNFF